MESGIRIQKLLSSQGILSRRKTEEAIRQKRIMVNGRPATIGHQIDPSRDIVTLDGKEIPLRKDVEQRYLMLHKPRGYVTTTEDQHGRRTVMDLVKGVNERVYPVGRLDLDSEGLLFLTNDGTFANEIMHPSSELHKTYRVTIRGPVSEEQLVQLATGVTLEDGVKTHPASVHVLVEQPDRTVLQISVIEGLNRLIRRMCAGVGLELIRLKRTHIGPVKLGMLPPGDWRELTPEELRALRNVIKKGQNRSHTK